LTSPADQVPSSMTSVGSCDLQAGGVFCGDKYFNGELPSVSLAVTKLEVVNRICSFLFVNILLELRALGFGGGGSCQPVQIPNSSSLRSTKSVYTSRRPFPELCSSCGKRKLGFRRRLKCKLGRFSARFPKAKDSWANEGVCWPWQRRATSSE